MASATPGLGNSHSCPKEDLPDKSRGTFPERSSAVPERSSSDRKHRELRRLPGREDDGLLKDLHTGLLLPWSALSPTIQRAKETRSDGIVRDLQGENVQHV